MFLRFNQPQTMFKDYSMISHIIAGVWQPQSPREVVEEIPMGRKVPEGTHPILKAREVHARLHLSTVHWP
jgi:hypothetical protein